MRWFATDTNTYYVGGRMAETVCQVGQYLVLEAVGELCQGHRRYELAVGTTSAIVEEYRLQVRINSHDRRT